MHTDEARKRLGDAIVRRRESMSPPLTRTQLAKTLRMGDRRLGDIERGTANNVRPSTRDVIERALGWEPGSWDRVLAGGEPTLAPPRKVRRSDEPDDVVYIMRNAGKASPETLRALRTLIETDLERNGQDES